MKHLSLKDRRIVTGILFLGFVLTAFLLYVAAQRIQTQAELRFEKGADRASNLISTELRAADESLQNIAAIFSVSSSEVDSDGFRMMAETTLAQQESVQFVAFASWVPASQKVDFERQNWRASGVAEFRIHGLGTPQAKDLPDFYAPIVFIEPLTPLSISSVGFDLWSDPQLKIKVMEAIEGGQSVPAVTFSPLEKKGFALLKAVYSGKVLPSTSKSRQKAVIGILRVSLSSKELMSVLDAKKGYSASLIDNKSQTIGILNENPGDSSAFDMVLETRRKFRIGDTEYQLVLHHLVPMSISRLWPMILILVMGISASLFIANRVAQLLRAQRESTERNIEIEQKVLEKTRAHQQSEKLLRQVMDSNPNVIFAQTEDFKILFANQKFFQIFERSPQEVYGQTINLDLPGQRGLLMNSLEEQILMPNGDYHWFETTRIAIELEGHGPSYLVVAVDISQKKIDEAVIAEQRAKMFSSSKLSALGEMAGGVAHEINTPLTTILLLSEQISKILKSPEPNLKIIDHHAQVITRTAGRIAKVVSGLRSFSRDGGADRMMRFCLIETLEETLALCREKFFNAGVKLECDFPSSLSMVGRSVQISQVVLNLLNNSFDAVQGKEIAWIHIKVTDLGSSVQIAIEDSGSGISEEARGKIFQPFFTTKETGQGTGLGLSIAKGIVESHNGQITCDQNAAHTRFVIELPKDQPGWLGSGQMI